MENCFLMNTRPSKDIDIIIIIYERKDEIVQENILQGVYKS